LGKIHPWIPSYPGVSQRNVPTKIIFQMCNASFVVVTSLT